MVMEEESEGCGVKKCRSTLSSGSTSRPNVQDVVGRYSIILPIIFARNACEKTRDVSNYCVLYVAVGLFEYSR